MYWLAGCDEVGRGALAGPLVAAAVLVRSHQAKPRWLPKGRDSKLFTANQRQALADRATKSFLFSIAWAEAAEIDQIGIQRANQLVVGRAVANLPIVPNKLLIDYIAGFTSRLPYELLKHGDRDQWPIALASIIAKVYRDSLMKSLAVAWPDHGFNRHVGYGTARHLQAINQLGLTPLHRQSFLNRVKLRQII
jgi:ribonuclease HII